MRARWLIGLSVAAAGIIAAAVTFGLKTVHAMDAQRKYEFGRAPDFLFQKERMPYGCAGWPEKQPRRGSFVTFSPRAPFRQTRETKWTLARKDLPALTLAADMTTFVTIAGEERPDWSLKLCAKGDGTTEAEARGKMESVSLARMGDLFSVEGRGSVAQPDATADVLVQGPVDAPTTFHSSFGAIKVYDMDGPVRVATPRGRATILHTTGRVDVTGEIVDYAGAKGTVTLNASAEIDLKLIGPRFDGMLSAMAERSVRVLTPKGFATPFEAVVEKRDDFACRADFCAQVKEEKKSGLYFFSYGGPGGDAKIHLRSEHGPVVMDTTTE